LAVSGNLLLHLGSPVRKSTLIVIVRAEKVLRFTRRRCSSEQTIITDCHESCCPDNVGATAMFFSSLPGQPAPMGRSDEYLSSYMRSGNTIGARAVALPRNRKSRTPWSLLIPATQNESAFTSHDVTLSQPRALESGKRVIVNVRMILPGCKLICVSKSHGFESAT
jgi:hypothetical protein